MLQGYKNEYHNSTKLLVGNGYLLKLLFSGKQPVVVRELGHGQLKWLGRYSMPPSMLKKKNFLRGRSGANREVVLLRIQLNCNEPRWF